MSQKIYVVPALGKPLPFPGGVLPVEGDWVDPADTFWRRRLADQDVTKSKPPAATDAVEEPASSAEPAATSKPKK